QMIDLDAYFRRIGYSGSGAPTLGTLAALHALHPTAIPFENLDTLRGAQVRLDLESLQQKLVRQQRGGYCFEQNLLFTHVLTALGFGVTGLGARVLWERPESAPGGPRTHMLLLVAVGAARYVCDVGFGGLTLTGPLRLVMDVEQPTPHEMFRFTRDGNQNVMQANVRGAWRSLYSFDLAEQLQADVEMANFFVGQYPESPFRSHLMVARRVGDRTLALGDARLRIHHRAGPSETRELASVADLRATLGELFAIDVPVDPALDAALARLIG
ncbi:MAG TPA: arylamine N-acetyltransferase, partial [Gammaproteobacteria bacterium]|nr:arylamine N-acetyltransferase [Gammaproteobacteria bacterium]